DGVLRVLAETKFLVVMNLTRLAAIVALMGTALRLFDLQGPVIVTLFGMLIAKTVALFRIQRLLRSPFRQLMPWLNLGGIAIVAMLAAILPAFMSAHLSLPSLYVLPLSGAVYLAGYISLLLLFGLLQEGEKNALINVLGRQAVALARKPE